MKKRTVSAVAWCFLSAACVAGGQRATIVTTTTLAPDTTVERTTPVGGITYGPAAQNRIVVTTMDGSIVIVDPDGSNRVVLLDGAADAGAFPVWSPSGERIAWTEAFAGSNGEVRFSIVTANVDGSDRTRMQTPFPSYYTAWDSTSRALGVLGNDAEGRFGTALAIGRADRDSVADVLDGGITSYYFAWDADRTAVIAHTDNGVRYVEPGQDVVDLGFGAGLYQPPLITGEPGAFVFGQGADSLGLVRVADLESGTLENLAFYKGNASMMMHPDGTKVAIVTTGRRTAVDDDDPVPTDDLVLLEPGVDILDLGTRAVERVADEPVLALFWSPDGEKLLMAGLAEFDGAAYLRWQLYRDNELRPVGGIFLPGPIFGERVLPFFDQFALSSTLWSPDSTQFTYPGRNVAGEQGIWVYDVVDNTSELIVEGGTLAFWSPT